MNNDFFDNNEYKNYLKTINEIAEDNTLSEQEKVKKIIEAYDAEVKRILYTNQGLTPPEKE